MKHFFLKRHLLCFFFLCSPCFSIEEGIVTLAYYDYPSNAISGLDTLSTDFVMNIASLHKWDRFILQFIKEQKMTKDQLYRLYAYIYTAQRDAATLAYESKGAYVGSLDPITLAIFKLFYPFFTPSFAIEEDEFSHQIAQAVFPNFKRRYLNEEAKILSSAHSLHIFYWTGLSLDFQESTLAWTPWVLSPIAAHSLSTPISQTDWERFSKKLVKNENWINITNEIITSKEISFEKFLLVRSVVAIALYDAIITNAKLKYIYGVDNLDPHASESPLHITLGYTVFSLLNYFFPEKQLDPLD